MENQKESIGSKQYYSFFDLMFFCIFGPLEKFWSSGFLFIRFSGFGLQDQLVINGTIQNHSDFKCIQNLNVRYLSYHCTGHLDDYNLME